MFVVGVLLDRFNLDMVFMFLAVSLFMTFFILFAINETRVVYVEVEPTEIAGVL